MNSIIKSTMLRFLYFFSILIFIFEATKANAKNIGNEKFKSYATLPRSAYNQSKAEEMCEKYITQFCKTPIPTSNSTSNSTKIVDNTNGIFGGRKAKPKEYPHMALLGVDKNWFCGGSLISENFVLTAAHCTNHAKLGAPKEIRLGELNLVTTRDDARTVDYSIKKTIVHPKYNTVTFENDIALLKFEGLTSFSEYIRPICLNTLNNIPNHNFTATGWGSTKPGGKMSNELRTVDLYPQDNQKCKSKYGVRFDDNTVLCFGYAPGGKDTCNGDSGGPLQIIENKKPECPGVTIFTQFGVTSFGVDDCGRVNTPAGYMKVSYVLHSMD